MEPQVIPSTHPVTTSENTVSPSGTYESPLLVTDSLPRWSAITPELIAIIESQSPEERLGGIQELSELCREGDLAARDLLIGCTWDLDEEVRQAATRALAALGTDVPSIPIASEAERHESLLNDLSMQIENLAAIPNVLRRHDALQKLSRQASYFQDEFQEAVAGYEQPFIHSLLKIERDIRLLYSARELDDNFPDGWIDEQNAIDSLVVRTPHAQEILFDSYGSIQGGIYAAELLAIVLKCDFDRGAPIQRDRLRDALFSTDLHVQNEAITTVARLGQYAELILPGVTHLLKSLTEDQEQQSPRMKIVPEVQEAGEQQDDPYKEDLESLTEKERENRAVVRGLVRAITSETMHEVGIPRYSHYNYDIRFLKQELMGDSNGFAMPSLFVIHEKFGPVLSKILEGEELDQRELYRALTALNVILHEGRHLAQYRITPYSGSAACVEEILKPGIRYLSKAQRAEAFDGARSSALSWAQNFDLSERLGEEIAPLPDNDEEKEPLSIERLRSSFIREVDAYSYATIKLFDFALRFPSLRAAWEEYKDQPPPSDDAFYDFSAQTEQERKASFHDLVKLKAGDTKPFSYYRKAPSTER